MKKIVALVLSLVMALSLCTVAFADGVENGVYNLDGKKLATTKFCAESALETVKAHTAKAPALSNVKYYVVNDVTAYETYYKVVCSNETEWTEDDDGKLFETAKAAKNWFETTCAMWLEQSEDNTYVVEAYDVEVEYDTWYLIPCTRDDADLALYKNGAWNEWLMVADEDDAYYHFDATAQKATSAKPNCTTTQFLEDGYLDADGCCFFVANENGDVKLNVNGKIVKASNVSKNIDYVIWASHIFAKGVENEKTGYDVATCLVCKGEFACTDSLEVATKSGYKISTMFSYDSAEAANVYDANKYENGYDFAWGQTYAGDYEYCWQLKAGTTEEIGTATETETKTEGVESAKTFDAGIAMYVGMSLMSVAGTAVVIGKKKEF